MILLGRLDEIIQVDDLDLEDLRTYLEMRKVLEIVVILHLIFEIYLGICTHDELKNLEVQEKIFMNKKEKLQKKKKKL